MRSACTGFLSLAAVTAALVVSGCGGSDGAGAAAGDGPDPASVMPKSAALYVEGVIDPEGDQADAVRELAGRVLKTDDPARKVKDLIDRELANEAPGATIDDDVDPWLGDRVGIATTNLAGDSAGFIAAIALDDAGKARDFLATQAKRDGDPQRTYAGTTYFVDDEGQASGVVDDFLVAAGDEADFKRAVDTSKGESLADVQAFEDAVGDLPDERVGTLYMDPSAFADAAAASAGDPSASAIVQNAFKDVGAVAGFAQAAPDAATLETRTAFKRGGALAKLAGLAAGGAPELVQELPDDAWAAFGFADLGETVRTGLDSVAGGLGSAVIGGQVTQATGLDLERDLLSWMGDAAVFVRGASMGDLGGALVVQATDEGKAVAALPRIVNALTTRGGVPFSSAQVSGADQAWTATVPDAPGRVVIARTGDRVVLALGEEAASAALQPSGTLGDSALYDRAKDALDGLEPSFLVDGPTLVRLIGEGAGSDPDFAKAKPYLDLLDLLAAGTDKDGDVLRQRVVAKVK